MPALTFKGHIINFSYADDALTFYPAFPYYEGDNEHRLRNCLDVVEECGNLDFVIKRLPDEQSTPKNEGFIAALEHIKDKKSAQDADSISSPVFYDKFVRRTDDDHMLYHREEVETDTTFRLEASHWHVKFQTILTREQISAVLDIFITKDLINADEKNNFLACLDERYNIVRRALDSKIISNKEEDTSTILGFIQTCKDNDTLADLHDYLAEKKFDYLRVHQEKTDSNQVRYQGMDRAGAIVETSEEWAKIEKAIALQMSNNIRTQCTKFTSEMGTKFAERLHNQYRFFGIKRKAKENRSLEMKNEAYLALASGDAAALTAKSNKIFSK